MMVKVGGKNDIFINLLLASYVKYYATSYGELISKYLPWYCAKSAVVCWILSKCRKTFAVSASSVLEVLKKAIAHNNHWENFCKICKNRTKVLYHG